MTVSELMEILEGMEEDTEVRLAMQPSWPFEYSIGRAEEVDGVLYLAEDQQLRYLPGQVSQALGWGDR